jgi:hypothetical protein
MRAHFIACLLLFHFALTRADDGEYASVLLDPLSNRLYVEEDVLEGAVAWARFSNQVNKTGYIAFVSYTLSELSYLILFIF